jgi:hypothetical protein
LVDSVHRAATKVIEFQPQSTRARPIYGQLVAPGLHHSFREAQVLVRTPP